MTLFFCLLIFLWFIVSAALVIKDNLEDCATDWGFIFTLLLCAVFIYLIYHRAAELHGG
jgi:Ca2+/Na+ antiporter